MNATNFFCVIFFVSSFYEAISGYSFHKTFKSPKENYDELVEEKDKLEILERSNFSIEEDENEKEKSKATTPEGGCPRAIATAQVHVRFGKESGENEKNENEFHVPNIQHQFYEKQSLMFDPFLYQQFLYYMFLNGGLFGHHLNCGHFRHPSRNIPDCRNFHYYPHHSSPNYMLPYYYNPNTHFLNSNSKRNCRNNSRIKKQIQNWDEIQNVPVKQLTKHELQLLLKNMDNDEYEENNNKKSMKLTLEESFPQSTAATSPHLKRYQKRSITQNCKSSSIYQNNGLKVTNNLELIAVNISEIW